MATEIHPAAIVDPRAELGDGVRVGPYSVIGPDVRVGAGTVIYNHVTLAGHTTLGQQCVVFPSAVLGMPPQDLKYQGGPTTLEVGAHSVIREFVTLHLGTELGGGRTRLGAHDLIMAYAHVAHDCQLGDCVILSNAAQLAGHVLVDEGARIGGVAAVHQFVHIGRFSFVAGMARLAVDVPPFTIAEGHPARIRALNEEGLRRRGIPDEQVDGLKKAFRLLFRSDFTRDQAQAELETRGLGRDPYVMELLDFLRAVDLGKHGRSREGQRPGVPLEKRDGSMSFKAESVPQGDSAQD